MKASRISCQASIEHWCVLTRFSLYISIFMGCKIKDIAYKKLSRLSSKKKIDF